MRAADRRLEPGPGAADGAGRGGDAGADRRERPSAAWQWTVAFAGSFLLLLPATAAMGATLPAMQRVLAAGRPAGASLALLYAANTAGAVLGVLAAAFWLVAAYGLTSTALLCAVLNLTCAPRRNGRCPPWPTRLRRRRHATSIRTTGACCRCSRSPACWASATRCSWCACSASSRRTRSTPSRCCWPCIWSGPALGAAAWRRRAGLDGPASDTRRRLCTALGVACLVGTASLWGAQASLHWVRQHAGGGMAAALSAEAAMALLAFGLPTLVMGALFSHLATEATRAGIGLGRALAFNTLGAALAPVVFGLLLAPALGAKATLLAIVAGYLLLGLRRQRPTPAWAVATSAAAAVGIWAPAFGLRRRARGRACGQLSRRAARCGQRGRGRPGRVPPAHRQPPAGGQQRDRLRRRAPGPAAPAAASAAAAGAVSSASAPA